MNTVLQKARSFFSRRESATAALRSRRACRERRKIQRLACHQPFECSDGKESWPVTVVDLGFGGFKIRSQAAVGKRGDLLHLRRLSGEHSRKLGGSYTTGMIVRVAWTKCDPDGYESGLYLPDAPGSMRIRWFKELLRELDLDETEIFSKRSTRRHRCRLPAALRSATGEVQSGLLLDLSPGGGLLATSQVGLLGTVAELEVTWGVKTLRCEATLVGVRSAESTDQGPHWLHSLKFEEPMSGPAEKVLYSWLEELAQDD